MIATKPARIFKADKRTLKQSEDFRCLSTLNPKGAEYEKPSLGALTTFDDETLAMGKYRFYYMEEDTLVILMPLVGLLEVEESKVASGQLLIPEEIKILSLKKGQSFYLANPHKKDLVNFLQIRIRGTGLTTKKSFGGYVNNSLFPIFRRNECQFHFGVFEGRKEAVYQLQNPKNGVFAFVINGAFEFENRLLESRDALSLWDVETVELEALSENAIIVLLEVAPN